MMKKIKLLGALLLCAVTVLSAQKPNVLLISVDDLNDWVGCLGGGVYEN
jgi:hypothetical protein